MEPPAQGWYDTGDIVTVDEAGYVSIIGRAKRFAKLGGEMISLTAVESLAATLWPGFQHAVVALADPRRGERLVLVSNATEVNRAAMLTAVKEQGLPELMVPKSIQQVDKVPVLGTGKTDYGAVKALATT